MNYHRVTIFAEITAPAPSVGKFFERQIKISKDLDKPLTNLSAYITFLFLKNRSRFNLSKSVEYVLEIMLTGKY